jgi:hypothetical protein
MSSDLDASDVVARYEPNRQNPLLLLSGVVLLILIGYRFLNSSDEERLVTLTLLALLGIVVGAVGVASLFTVVVAVELRASGAVDFRARLRRISLPRTALLRIEGQTRISRSQAAHSVRFVFEPTPEAVVVRRIGVPSPQDPALHDFVRRLEHSNPRLDTAPFWAWSQGEVAPPTAQPH